MPARENLVYLPPSGFVIALGYWAGDVAQALRLARLIADIEGARRDDVAFAFCPRFDLAWDREQQAAFMHVAGKLPTLQLRQAPPHVTGHPDAPNAMMASTFGQLAEAWHKGHSRHDVVFLCEPDGVPLSRDWISRLLRERDRMALGGRRACGSATLHPVPHYNGSLLLHCSAWFDLPSIRETPPGHAWDLYHATALFSAGTHTTEIKNVYGGEDWSAAACAAMSRETAWLSSTKDDSALSWAERTLVAPRAAAT